MTSAVPTRGAYLRVYKGITRVTRRKILEEEEKKETRTDTKSELMERIKTKGNRKEGRGREGEGREGWGKETRRNGTRGASNNERKGQSEDLVLISICGMTLRKKTVLCYEKGGKRGAEQYWK